MLAGKGNICVGQAAPGDWQFLQKIDSSASTGTVIIPGATAGNATNAISYARGNPVWLFGSDAGLLDDTGTGAFNLTSVVLGSGLTVVDVSSASAAQVAKLTTAPGTGVTVHAGNEIIVQDSVATTTTADTFKNIAGFDTLGIGGPTNAQGAAGTINQANLPGSINTIDLLNGGKWFRHHHQPGFRVDGERGG